MLKRVGEDRDVPASDQILQCPDMIEMPMCQYDRRWGYILAEPFFGRPEDQIPCAEYPRIHQNPTELPRPTVEDGIDEAKSSVREVRSNFPGSICRILSFRQSMLIKGDLPGHEHALF